MATSRFTLPHRTRNRLFPRIAVCIVWVIFLGSGGGNLAIAEDAPLDLQHWVAFLNGQSDPASRSSVREQREILGPISCSSSSCHGSRTVGASQSELAFTIWQRLDPHARAYETLTGPESREIANKLQLPQPAHESTVCLNCHGSPHSFTRDRPTASPAGFPLASHGVSCESCHGAAANWIEPHRGHQWNSQSPSARTALGFQDLSSHFERAQVCANCHIGSIDRDVTHQLIAAGHPRLVFEYTAYLDLYSAQAAHWDLTRQSQANSDAASDTKRQAWITGQLVSAQKAQELTHLRAQSNTAEWPELAEFDCYACHHDLASKNSPQPNSAQLRLQNSGSVWPIQRSRFYTVFLPEIATLPPEIDPELFESLAELNDLVQRMRTDDRAGVASLSHQVSTRLKTAARASERAPLSEKSLRQLEQSLFAEARLEQIPNWDVAAQYYLLLAAWHQDELRNHSDRPEALIRLRRNLAFGTRQNSPEFYSLDALRSEISAAAPIRLP